MHNRRKQEAKYREQEKRVERLEDEGRQEGGGRWRGGERRTRVGAGVECVREEGGLAEIKPRRCRLARQEQLW